MYLLIILKPIYDFEKYIHMVWRIQYWIRMYVIHTIRRIRHIDEDEWRQPDIDGRKRPNGWNWTDECRTEANEHRMELWRTTMNGGWQRITIATNGNYDDDNAIERSTSVSSITMECRREERNYFFILFHVFF